MGRLHHPLMSGPARAVAIVLLVVCGFAVAPAQAALIDFQDQPLGPYLGDIVTLTTQGVSVTFSGMDLMIRDIVQPQGRPPGASRVMWTYITYDAITATFEGGFTTDFVQIRELDRWGVFTGSRHDHDVCFRSLERAAWNGHQLGGVHQPRVSGYREGCI